MKVKNSMKFLAMVLALAGIVCFADFQPAEGVPMSAPANVVADVAVNIVTDGPSFGRIVTPTSGTQNFSIQPDGVPTTTGTGRFLDGQAIAQISIDAPPNTRVDITSTANAGLGINCVNGTSGTVTMISSTFNLPGSPGPGFFQAIGLIIDVTGQQTLNVGGEITVSFDALGTFSCSYDINAVLQ